MEMIFLSNFLEVIKQRARADKKTIVLPESMDKRTFEAAEKILKEDIANIVIIGTPAEIEEYGKGYDISGATIIDPYTYEKTDEYLNLFVELRKEISRTNCLINILNGDIFCGSGLFILNVYQTIKGRRHSLTKISCNTDT